MTDIERPNNYAPVQPVESEIDSLDRRLIAASDMTELMLRNLIDSGQESAGILTEGPVDASALAGGNIIIDLTNDQLIITDENPKEITEKRSSDDRLRALIDDLKKPEYADIKNQVDTVVGLIRETGASENSPEDIETIKELLEEVLNRWRVRHGAFLEIDEIKKKYHSGQNALGPEIELRPQYMEVSKSDIAWIKGESAQVQLELVVTEQGKSFYFGQITSENPKTNREWQRFTPEEQAEALISITNHCKWAVDQPDGRIPSHRALEGSGTTAKNTKFRAIKDSSVSAGDVQATRALLLQTNTGDSKTPVYLLASFCRHDQQQKLIYGL